jgi:hypothetical protein
LPAEENDDANSTSPAHLQQAVIIQSAIKLCGMEETNSEAPWGT